MSTMNGIGPGTVPDLGAIRAQQQQRAAAPAYDPGTPELALQIGTPRVNGQVSFTAALDAAAAVLFADGWEIVEVKQCGHAGDDQAGNAFFQLIMVARESAGRTRSMSIERVIGIAILLVLFVFLATRLL